MTDHESQAVPYVLGELDAAETAEFERHLPACDECTADVREMSEGLADLAFAAAEDPPATLRARTLDEAADLPQVAALRRSRRSLAAVLAVAAALALVVLGGVFVLQRPSPTDRILASSEAVTLNVAATEAYTGASALVEVVYLEESGEAVLVVDGLDAAPDGTTYEAWFIGDEGARPAGLFEGGQGRTALLLDAEFRAGDAFGITVEPQGGSTSPTGAVLFLGA